MLTLRPLTSKNKHREEVILLGIVQVFSRRSFFELGSSFGFICIISISFFHRGRHKSRLKKGYYNPKQIAPDSMVVCGIVWQKRCSRWQYEFFVKNFSQGCACCCILACVDTHWSKMLLKRAFFVYIHKYPPRYFIRYCTSNVTQSNLQIQNAHFQNHCKFECPQPNIISFALKNAFCGSLSQTQLRRK